MVDQINLKSCPFCGKEAVIEKGTMESDDGKDLFSGYVVMCGVAGCTAYLGGSVFKTPQDAASAWNKRADIFCGHCNEVAVYTCQTCEKTLCRHDVEFSVRGEDCIEECPGCASHLLGVKDPANIADLLPTTVVCSCKHTETLESDILKTTTADAKSRERALVKLSGGLCYDCQRKAKESSDV